MILITVGTTRFPFNRMNEIYNKICALRNNNEEVIYQNGYSNRVNRFRNVTITQFLPYKELQTLIKEARIVICHGGPATIYQCWMNEKKPIVLPREKKFGEHVNDHQVVFTQHLFNNNLIVLINDKNISLTCNKLSIINSNKRKKNELIAYLNTVVSL